MKRKTIPKPAWPEPPEGLSERAQALWRGAIGRCQGEARQELLRQACETLDRAIEAGEKVKGAGLVSAGKSGVQHVHPVAKLEAATRAQFLKLMVSLGLHMGGEPPTGARDPQSEYWEKMLKKMDNT